MIGYLGHLCFLENHCLLSTFTASSGSNVQCALLGLSVPLAPPSWPTPPRPRPPLLSHRQAYLCLLEPSLDSDTSWVVWNAVLMSIWNTTCEWTPTVCNYPAHVLHHCSVRLQLHPTSSKIAPGFQDGNGRALNQVWAPSESRACATAQLTTPDTSPHHQVPSSLFKELL